MSCKKIYMKLSGCQAQRHTHHNTWNAEIILTVLVDEHLEGESLPIVKRTIEATEILRLVFKVRDLLGTPLNLLSIEMPEHFDYAKFGDKMTNTAIMLSFDCINRFMVKPA